MRFKEWPTACPEMVTSRFDTCRFRYTIGGRFDTYPC